MKSTKRYSYLYIMNIYINKNIDNEYGIFLDTDDNNYFIRKYSDENIPIYNKKLQNFTEFTNERCKNEHLHIRLYEKNTKNLRQTFSIVVRVLLAGFIVYLAYKIYLDFSRYH
jgi:hypothetical protein